MNSPISRRRFMTLSAAGSAGLVVLPSRLARGFAANEKIQVGLIGVGGRGRWFVDTIPRLEQVVALCDVNEQKIDEAFKHWKEAGRRYAASPHEWERRAGAEFARLLESPPEVFHDFRQMIERMGKRLDAVVVATPDHTHAVASAAAMHEGKHVFCEKPLTRTVEESRRLRQLAREKKVATSMGNQGTYSGPFRRALELIRHGTIGRVEEVYVWNSGGGADRKQPPQSELPVPPYLHWDLWLGPAAFRPYHPDWMKRNLWREFGTCQLGNWGSHSANLAFMSLKVHHLWLDPPGAVRTTIKVSARSSGINRLSFPRWEAVDWEIPARADLPPITIHWFNGRAPGLQDVFDRAFEGGSDDQRRGWQWAGTFIVGTKGAIHTTGHNMWFRLLPQREFAGVQCQRPEIVEASRGPEQDWFRACRGGPRPWANFDYASALNEFLMLGNVATQFEEPLEFDPAAMKIANNAEADALLHPD